MRTTAPPLAQVATSLAQSAVAAASFGHEPPFMPYDTTCNRAGELVVSAIALMTEIHNLDDAENADAATQARHQNATAAFRSLKQQLAELLREHHATAQENEGPIAENSRIADTFAEEAKVKLRDLQG